LGKELKFFILAGVSAVATDLTLYYVIQDFLARDIAKGISFLVGTAVAFIINKYWTFEKPLKSYNEIIEFGMLYTVTLILNVITNRFILDVTGFVLFAFLVATGVSTVCNFLGQKFWVFK
jgi:putative flippase GtrA